MNVIFEVSTVILKIPSLWMLCQWVNKYMLFTFLVLPVALIL